MGYTLQIDADDSEPLASIRGLADMKKWVRTLPSDEGPRLRLLLDYGWAGQPENLASEVQSLLDDYEPARPDVRSTVQGLLHALRRAKIVVSITDGLGE